MLVLACACGGIGEVFLIGAIVTTIGSWLGIKRFMKHQHHETTNE